MKLVKCLTEVRFDSSLLFDDARMRNDIVKKLATSFSQHGWNDEQKAILLINPKIQVKCIIRNDRVIVDFDTKCTLDNLKTLGSTTVQSVMEALSIDFSQRIGIRAHYIHDEYDSDGVASSKIVNSFFNERVATILGNYQADSYQPKVGFHLNLDQRYSVNCNIAYHQVGKAEIGLSGEVTLLHADNTYPLTDLDIYTMIPNRPDQINGVFKHCISVLPGLFHTLWQDPQE